MLLNKPRAYEVMDRHGLDGLVAATQINIYYLTDFWGSLMRMRRSFYNYAILPRREEAPAALICSAVELQRFANVAEMPSWVPNVCAYSHPVSFETRNYDPDTEEPDVNQLGLRWPVRHDSLTTSDQEFMESLASYEGHYSATAALALRKALKDAELEEAYLGFDDPRVLQWMNEIGLGKLTGIEATNIFREIRVIKSPSELDILAEAGRRNEIAMNAAIATIRPGLPLQEIRLAHQISMASQDGHTVYILATQRGERDGDVLEGELIMLDALAEYRHYHGDIGRTAVVGEPTSEMRRRNEAMQIGCEIAYGAIRPGATGKDVTTKVLDGISKAGFSGFFIATPHSVGLEHSDHPLPIGLQMPGAYGDFVFEENMVFTLDMPYHEIGWGGMHLEDMVRVTRTGCEPMTSLDTSLRVCLPSK